LLILTDQRVSQGIVWRFHWSDRRLRCQPFGREFHLEEQRVGRFLHPNGISCTMSTRDEGLEQFVGGYFHQDWDVEGATSWLDVITHYAATVRREDVTETRHDLVDWLHEADAESSDSLPPAFGCDYNPRVDGLTDREWVRKVVDLFDHLLRT
jgi:hypothetical protein